MPVVLVVVPYKVLHPLLSFFDTVKAVTLQRYRQSPLNLSVWKKDSEYGMSLLTRGLLCEKVIPFFSSKAIAGATFTQEHCLSARQAVRA